MVNFDREIDWLVRLAVFGLVCAVGLVGYIGYRLYSWLFGGG